MKLKKAEKIEKICDYPGCSDAAEYRAPKSRDKVNDYYWFCLAHVREYNKKWNYYEGLSEEEIEMHLRHDVTWQRPSWPFGSHSKTEMKMREKVHNYFFNASARTNTKGKGFSENLMHADLSFAEKKAFEYLNATPDMSLEKIKSQYRKFVKEHHPDRHQGDIKKVEILKKINLAFAIIESYYHKQNKENK